MMRGPLSLSDAFELGMHDEQRPLLSDAEALPELPPQISIPAVAKALAALRAGALPATDQLSRLLRTFLHSPLLEVQGTIFSPDYGHGRIGVGGLTREGEQVRSAVRESVEALLRLLLEKNGDDCWQELIIAWKKAEVDIKLPSTSLASPPPELKQQARLSLFKVAITFLTSPELRALLADAILLVRDTFENAMRDRGPLAEKAGDVADSLAEGLAEKVAGDVRRKGKEKAAVEDEEGAAVEELLGDVKVAGEADEEERPLPRSPDLTPEELKDQFIDRLKTILTLIQKNPSYQASVHTIFVLARAYTRSIIDSLSVDATVLHPESNPSPIALLLPTLEPFAGGVDSLAPLAAALHRLKDHAHSENRVQILIRSVDTFLEHALLDAGYIGSAMAHRQATDLHDQLTALARDNPAFRANCATFFDELQKALSAIAGDRALRAMINSLKHLAIALEGWTAKAAKIAVGKDGVWGDVVEWVVPRIAGFLRQVPLPRIEFSSPNIDVALDPPPFLKTSFVPDTIRFDNASSFILTPATRDHPTQHDYSANSKLTITGVRMETEVGYWMRYRGACFSFVESGLLDLKFGTAQDGGIGLQADFSTIESEEEKARKKRLFEVVTSATTVTAFDLVPHESSHPFIMFFLRPILRRIVRTQVEAALQEQIRTGLETLSRIAWEVKARAGEGIVGWLGAMYEVIVQGVYADEEEAAEKPDVEEASRASEDRLPKAEQQDGPQVHVSSKGVTVDLEAGTVGVGAEGIVIPEGEAETPIPRPSIVEVVKDEVVGGVQSARESSEAVMEGIGELGEAVQHFPAEVEDQEAAVEKSGEWRSEAFNLAE